MTSYAFGQWGLALFLFILCVFHFLFGMSIGMTAKLDNPDERLSLPLGMVGGFGGVILLLAAWLFTLIAGDEWLRALDAVYATQ